MTLTPWHLEREVTLLEVERDSLRRERDELRGEVERLRNIGNRLATCAEMGWVETMRDAAEDWRRVAPQTDGEGE